VTKTNVTETVLGQLGIKFATLADFDELCFGADAPKPPKAKVTIGSGEGDNATAKVLSTFYDPSISNLPEEWTESKPAVIAFN
jgi:hypothetical protein